MAPRFAHGCEADFLVRSLTQQPAPQPASAPAEVIPAINDEEEFGGDVFAAAPAQEAEDEELS